MNEEWKKKKIEKEKEKNGGGRIFKEKKES